MEKHHVKLTDLDKEYLENLISKGSLTAKEFNRALALLELNKCKPYNEVSSLVKKTNVTLSSWANKYKETGLSFLKDKFRSGRPKEIDAVTSAKITALACSNAPDGYARWSLRLLTKKVIELNYSEEISKSTIGNILKKTT